jgi:tetratricopeptide (TPR) repeat protein
MATVSLTVSQVFDIALKSYFAGKLAEAEQMCRKILSADPASANTFNLLAAIDMAAGRNDAALANYDRALSLRPDFPEAWSNRGAALRAAGRHAEALESLDRALAIKPDHVETLNNRGIVLQTLGRHAEALAGYDVALSLRPDFVEALVNRGIARYELGRFDEALADYERAIALRPDNADALTNRGNALGRLQHDEKALDSYDAALALQPGHAGALYNRGLARCRLGRREEALADYDAALASRPDYPEALVSRGIVLLDLKRADDALQSCDRALALRPDYVEAHVNRGAALYDLGRAAEALASFDRATKLEPQNAQAHTNRGVTLHDMARAGPAATGESVARLEDALASHDRAVAARPDYPEAYVNRGVALYDLKRFDEALASYDRAIASRPDYADAHFLRGLAGLVTGDFERGWADYEWRKNAPVARLTPRDFSQPRWLGEDIAGKTILLHSEQGFGDSIQFCRYAPLVAKRGGRVILEVEQPLCALLRNLFGVAEIVAKGYPAPDFDLHCPLPSLPLAFRTRTEAIPAGSPYLRAPQDAMAQWERALGGTGGPRIGLVWAGSPNHVRDLERSMPFHLLQPLLDVEATFVSLQKELRPGETEMLMRSGVLNFGERLRDFADTAALVSRLDLVISVDTGVAHLAGALGQPVWILLTDAPDWRWQLDRDDSPWYPTARLFRQSGKREWSGVVARVREALIGFSSGAR